jgi:hypothetical protein
MLAMRERLAESMAECAAQQALLRIAQQDVRRLERECARIPPAAWFEKPIKECRL